VNRALPATYIDLARDGASDIDLRARGDRAVWSALVRVATSARQRGWAYIDLADLVMSPRSNLGRQVALRGGTKEVGKAQVEKKLRAAWDAAGAFLDRAPAAITPADVEGKAKALVAYCADADNGLRDADRAILAYASDEALRRGTDRPTLPLRAIAEATGLTVKAVRLALPRLDAAGLLRLEIRGVPGGPATRERRASAYRLGDVPAVAITEPTTTPETTDTEDDPMATITIDMATLTPEQRDLILSALAAMPVDDLTGANVVPLRRTA
jgi:hypothetical protein